MSGRKNEIEGRVDAAVGRVKEVAGKLTGNESLEAEGKYEKAVGDVQTKFGDSQVDLDRVVHRP